MVLVKLSEAVQSHVNEKKKQDLPDRIGKFPYYPRSGAHAISSAPVFASAVLIWYTHAYWVITIQRVYLSGSYAEISDVPLDLVGRHRHIRSAASGWTKHSSSARRCSTRPHPVYRERLLRVSRQPRA